MRKTLTDRGVAALKPRAGRYAEPDPELAGHYVRVQPSGAKSFAAVARDPAGKQIWTTIGATEILSVAQSRAKAREIIRRVREGLPAIEPKGDTFAAVAGEWMTRHVRKKKLRSADHVERLLRTRILPTLGDRPFVSIRRSDIARLLDQLEDQCGARQADYCLAVVRAIMNWHATRNDDYSPPVARGMRRQSAHAKARARILTDDELRAVWTAAETCGAFGAFVRIALLTAQRRTAVATMRWEEIEDGVWSIPVEPREKGNAGAVKLSDMALAIIEARPKFANNPYVFAAERGPGRLIGFSKAKAKLDRLSGTTGWTIHDLRRTARSMMSRAGVRPDHAERLMGHSIGGVEGTYDRHSYFAEKADALQRLAALIDSVVHPRDNVLPLERKGKRCGRAKQDGAAAR